MILNQQKEVDPFAGLPGTGDGTLANPIDVTRALAYIASGHADATEVLYKR